MRSCCTSAGMGRDACRISRACTLLTRDCAMRASSSPCSSCRIKPVIRCYSQWAWIFRLMCEASKSFGASAHVLKFSRLVGQTKVSQKMHTSSRCNVDMLLWGRSNSIRADLQREYHIMYQRQAPSCTAFVGTCLPQQVHVTPKRMGRLHKAFSKIEPSFPLTMIAQ